MQVMVSPGRGRGGHGLVHRDRRLATDVPAELLAGLYGRCSAPPSKATIWRVAVGAKAAAVDAVIGAWLADQAAARREHHRR